MKTLITKSDGTPTKSKVHALQFLEKRGISKDCLISENGQFYYESVETTLDVAANGLNSFNDDLINKRLPKEERAGQTDFIPVSWDTPVFDKNNERTKLIIPGTDVIATINGKHPAGQNKSFSCFEINIGNENFIMSVDLISKIFKAREV